MMPELEPFVKTSVIAKHLGFSTKTFDRWAKAGCPHFSAPGGEKKWQINKVVNWCASQTRKGRKKA